MAEVTGSQATMMANMPTFAQMRANAPMFSRFFCSMVSEGSIDQ